MSGDSNNDGWQADMSQALAGMSQTLDGYLRSLGLVHPVRCKECTNYNQQERCCHLLSDGLDGAVQMDPDDYCSYGERELSEDEVEDAWWEHYEHGSYDDDSSWGAEGDDGE